MAVSHNWSLLFSATQKQQLLEIKEILLSFFWVLIEYIKRWKYENLTPAYIRGSETFLTKGAKNPTYFKI